MTDLSKLLQETQDILSKPIGVTMSDSFEADLDFFLNIDARTDKQTLHAKICEEVEKVPYFPTAPTVSLMEHKSRLEFELGLYEKTALTMLESQGLAFHMQALHQYCKRTLNKTSNDLEQQEVKQKRDMLKFSKKGEMKEIVQTLPKSWRVVQVNIDDNQSQSRLKKTPGDQAIDKNFSLKIVTIDDHDVKVHQVPSLPNVDKMPSVQAELQDVLKTHLLMYKTDFDKSKYAGVRKDVDDRMQQLIMDMENRWLGFFKVLFLGHSTNKELLERIMVRVEERFFKNDAEFASSGRKLLLLKIIDGACHLTKDQVTKGILYATNQKQIPELAEFILQEARSQPIQESKRSPIVLILDKEVQGLPWETMPCLLGQPVSRVPSVQNLAVLYKSHLLNESSVHRTGIRQDKIFYVLNPDQNLSKTQAKIEPALASLSLHDGLIGKQPSLPQMKEVLSSMDAFMYCGHGSRLKHFSTQEIEKLKIRAVPLLFGCNSGKLERMGRQLDPIGTVQHYLIATAPCLLGFLWSITDKDVDQWTIQFLKHWLPMTKAGTSPQQPEFVQAVADMKPGFERIINRAAVVVYGLPTLK